MFRKIFIAAFALTLLVSAAGCGDKDKDELPYSYENKENSELIPIDGVEEHGYIDDSDDDGLPSEDELGEYEEILMNGDILDDGVTVAGWVVRISIKDITVNTYNVLTTYVLESNAKNAADHIKPGDAVLLSYTEDDEGTKTAYELGRVRVEDEPLTKEEIDANYAALQEQEAAESGENGDE